MPFKITKTAVPDVLVVEPKVFPDERGFFAELFKASEFKALGVAFEIKQVNHSRSQKNVLRGLHYQLNPHAQAKLVQVLKGEIFDVAVDIRKRSPTFGRWGSGLLDDQNHPQMYIPPGFAHGFCVLSAEADFMYKCTDYYHPESEQGIAWNDPDLGIEWPVLEIILSDKDQQYPRLAEQPLAKLPLYGNTR